MIADSPAKKTPTEEIQDNAHTRGFRTGYKLGFRAAVERMRSFLTIELTVFLAEDDESEEEQTNAEI